MQYVICKTNYNELYHYIYSILFSLNSIAEVASKAVVRDGVMLGSLDGDVIQWL